MEPIIDLQSDAYFMSEALRMAVRAYEAEEVPIGAVVVREGRIIARAFNQVELLKDATAHAEMLALTQAEAAVGDWRLTDCDLFVTKEPCPMCAGALVHVRMRRVVFGCEDPRGWRCRWVVESAPKSVAQPPVRYHLRRPARRLRRPCCRVSFARVGLAKLASRRHERREADSRPKMLAKSGKPY